MLNKKPQLDLSEPGRRLPSTTEVVPHGVMFHHFWDGTTKTGTGAATPEQLERIISDYGVENIIPAKEWFEEATNGNLSHNKICITLDDALRSQLEHALPVLDKYGLTAFWFIYSSVFEEQTSKFEIFRYFSVVCFDSFDKFFDAFINYLAKIENSEIVAIGRMAFLKSGHLKEYLFYSRAEREYRYFRDKVLGKEKFENLIDGMLDTFGMSYADLANGLWMNNDDLIDLTRGGHIVGLHSYSHPTDLAALSYADQKKEYQKNMTHIETVTGIRPKVVSHPVNSYDHNTLQILNDMGVEVGFRSNMFMEEHGVLEYPRADCANIIDKISI